MRRRPPRSTLFPYTPLFRSLKGNLEVAMGLETAHPQTLERLNKKFNLAEFAQAADFLRTNKIGLRVFLLVNPPFIEAQSALDRKSTRLNSSHSQISYAVFCL